MKTATIEEKKEPMRFVQINTLNGRTSLYDLCENVGVKARVAYYNFIETKAPKSIRTVDKPFIVRKVVFDKGLIFNNGVEIRHVEHKYWKLYKAEVIEKRERLIK